MWTEPPPFSHLARESGSELGAGTHPSLGSAVVYLSSVQAASRRQRPCLALLLPRALQSLWPMKEWSYQPLNTSDGQFMLGWMAIREKQYPILGTGEWWRLEPLWDHRGPWVQVFTRLHSPIARQPSTLDVEYSSLVPVLNAGPLHAVPWTAFMCGTAPRRWTLSPSLFPSGKQNHLGHLIPV